jgi:hypothetical protein
VKKMENYTYSDNYMAEVWLPAPLQHCVVRRWGIESRDFHFYWGLQTKCRSSTKAEAPFPACSDNIFFSRNYLWILWHFAKMKIPRAYTTFYCLAQEIWTLDFSSLLETLGQI